MFDHMIGFLNWLNDRRLDVMYFFGQLYSQALDVIRNAWQWIQERYYDALRYVRETTESIYRIITDRYNQAIKTAWDYALSFYNNAVNFARSHVDNFIRWLRGLIDDVARYASYIRQEVIDFAVRLVNEAKGYLIPLIESVRRFFQERIDSVVRFIESVKASILRDVLSIQMAIGWQSPDRLKTLLMFLGDPLGFVLAYVKRYFLFILEWSLAYAIGSTKENLPPWPNWKDVN